MSVADFTALLIACLAVALPCVAIFVTIYPHMKRKKQSDAFLVEPFIAVGHRLTLWPSNDLIPTSRGGSKARSPELAPWRYFGSLGNLALVRLSEKEPGLVVGLAELARPGTYVLRIVYAPSGAGEAIRLVSTAAGMNTEFTFQTDQPLTKIDRVEIEIADASSNQ